MSYKAVESTYIESQCYTLLTCSSLPGRNVFMKRGISVNWKEVTACIYWFRGQKCKRHVFFVDEDLPTALSHDVDISAEAVWNYLSSHTNWKILLEWIRAMANSPQDNPSLCVGETFSVREGNVVLPRLSRSVFSQMNSCHKIVREMVLEELTRLVQLWTSV